MSKLIYITNASLDGYIEDKTGAFDWGNPDQVFDFITELMRPIGTHLLGRRLYETMAHWDGPLEGYPPEHRDFARVWQKAEQIVFSRTLTRAPTRIARVEREFDPEATRKLKCESVPRRRLGVRMWRERCVEQIRSRANYVHQTRTSSDECHHRGDPGHSNQCDDDSALHRTALRRIHHRLCRLRDVP